MSLQDLAVLERTGGAGGCQTVDIPAWDAQLKSLTPLKVTAYAGYGVLRGKTSSSDTLLTVTDSSIDNNGGLILGNCDDMFSFLSTQCLGAVTRYTVKVVPSPLNTDLWANEEHISAFIEAAGAGNDPLAEWLKTWRARMEPVSMDVWSTTLKMIVLGAWATLGTVGGRL